MWYLSSLIHLPQHYLWVKVYHVYCNVTLWWCRCWWWKSDVSTVYAYHMWYFCVGLHEGTIFIWTYYIMRSKRLLLFTLCCDDINFICTCLFISEALVCKESDFVAGLTSDFWCWTLEMFAVLENQHIVNRCSSQTC